MLDATVLKNLMKTKIQAITNFPVQGQSPVIVDDRVLQALAESIVTHITSAAAVQPGTFAVTTAPGAVTGVGTIQ